MSDFFEVNPQALDGLANTLDSLGPVIEQLKSVTSMEASGLGGSEIEDAITGLSSHWSYGASQLEHHVQNLAKNTAQAAVNYQDADNSVAKAAAKIA